MASLLDLRYSTTAIARMEQPPVVQWGQNESGEDIVHVPDVAGPLAWGTLHSWAQSVHDWMCPICGDFAIRATRALHDVVNVKLGKPVLDQANLEEIAGVFASAAAGEQWAKTAIRYHEIAHTPHTVSDSGPGLSGIIPREFARAKVQSKLVRSKAKGKPIFIFQPTDLQPFFKHMRNADREWILAVHANQKNEVIGLQELNVGDQTSATIDAAALYRTALLLGANNIFLAHNHPSGNPQPSDADRSVFQSLKRTCDLFEINVRDFIVVGTKQDYSIEGGVVLDVPADLGSPAAAQVASRGLVVPMPSKYGSRCRDLITGMFIEGGDCPPVAPDVDLPLAPGDTFAFGPNGVTRYQLDHALIELRDVITSNDPFTFERNPDYPQEFQPRQRDRAATRLQVLRIAAGLDADQMLLDFHAIDRGSPIVMPIDGGGMAVLSGNGRTMALALTARANGMGDDDAELRTSWRRYQAALAGVAGSFGLSVEGMDNPLLVRIVEPGTDPVAFAKEANAPVTLSESTIENARVDAERLSLELVLALDVGDDAIEDAIRANRNSAFSSRFLAGLSSNEQAALVDADGRLNQAGLRRAVAAVFVRALPGRAGLELAERAFESIDQEVRTAINGIGRALGSLAQAEALVADGQRDAMLAIGEDVAEAVAVFAKVKRTAGLTVTDYLAQSQLFARELTPFREVLLTFFDERSRSAKRIGDALRAYADAVIAQPPPEQTSFFDVSRPTREELWARTITDQLAPMVAARGAVAERSPRDLVDWCNSSEDQQAVAWGWRSLRELLMIGAAQSPTEITVCSTGLTDDAFQVTFDFGGRASAEAIVRKAAVRLAGNAREVPEFGSTRIVFEVVIPSAPDELSFEPQTISRAPVRVAPELQPTLFQRGGTGLLALRVALPAAGMSMMAGEAPATAETFAEMIAENADQVDQDQRDELEQMLTQKMPGAMSIDMAAEAWIVAVAIAHHDGQAGVTPDAYLEAANYLRLFGSVRTAAEQITGDQGERVRRIQGVLSEGVDLEQLRRVAAERYR